MTAKLHTYKCAACGGIYARDSGKAWIKSICKNTGKDSRLILQKTEMSEEPREESLVYFGIVVAAIIALVAFMLCMITHLPH